MKFERKLRADFLEPGSLALLIKNVSVPAHKDKVSLVVECHDLPPRELRDVREEGNKEPAYSMAQARAKVVQDQFRRMRAGAAVVVDLLVQPNTGQLEDSRGSCWELYKADRIKAFPGFVDNYQMRILPLDGTLHNIF